MSTGPTLQTARMELKPLEREDEERLRALFSLEPVRRYLLDGRAPEPSWVAQVVADSEADFERCGLGLWTARARGEAEWIGLVGFRSFFDPPVEELIYALDPAHWGRGIAAEMARAVVAHAFSVGRDRVRASTDLPNEGSMVLLRRLGFRETGREPTPPGSLWEQVHWDLTRA